MRTIYKILKLFKCRHSYTQIDIHRCFSKKSDRLPWKLIKEMQCTKCGNIKLYDI